MAIEVKDSDLYQNGRIIQLDGDEQLLSRELLEPKQELTDNYIQPKSGDELPLLAFGSYKDVVKNANQYWWLIADRNEIFNPLSREIIIDGELVPMSSVEIVLPNILKQQPEFSVVK